MQSLFIATIIFSIFCFAGKSDAAAKKSDDNDASNRVNAPGVNEYLVATFEVATTFTSQNDGIKVQKLAYNIAWYFWWWCLRICKYYYYSGGRWILVYQIYYWYPCWRFPGWPWWPWWPKVALNIQDSAICEDLNGFAAKSLAAGQDQIVNAKLSCGGRTFPVNGDVNSTTPQSTQPGQTTDNSNAPNPSFQESNTGGTATSASADTSSIPEKSFVFEVTTNFDIKADIQLLHDLTYRIIRPYWWWCFRICTYHYYNGYFWVVRYTIIYRYPCWPWYYALNAVVNADGSRAAASDDGTNDRFDIVAIGKEALNTDPLNIRSICVIFNDKIFEYVSKCYAEDAVCSA